MHVCTPLEPSAQKALATFVPALPANHCCRSHAHVVNIISGSFSLLSAAVALAPATTTQHPTSINTSQLLPSRCWPAVSERKAIFVHLLGHSLSLFGNIDVTFAVDPDPATNQSTSQLAHQPTRQPAC